jgi:hypothetical protein
MAGPALVVLGLAALVATTGLLMASYCAGVAVSRRRAAHPT